MNNKWAALEIFKPIKHSTLQEQQAYENMLNKYSIPFKKGVYLK